MWLEAKLDVTSHHNSRCRQKSPSSKKSTRLMLKMTRQLVCSHPTNAPARRLPHTHSPAKLTSEEDGSLDEPTTGLAYWEKRRAEWLQGSSKPRPEAANSDNGPGSRARARLEALLAPPLAEEDDMIWNDTVSGIWKGLSRGDRLKKNLPLPVLVRRRMSALVRVSV